MEIFGIKVQTYHYILYVTIQHFHYSISYSIFKEIWHYSPFWSMDTLWWLLLFHPQDQYSRTLKFEIYYLFLIWESVLKSNRERIFKLKCFTYYCYYSLHPWVSNKAVVKMKALHVHLKQFNVSLIHIVVSTPTCTLKQFISLW